MNIRPAAFSEAQHFQKIAISLSHFYLLDGVTVLPEWMAQTLTREAFEQRLQDSEFKHFSYCQDGKIVGYIAIKSAQHIYHLFIDQEYQGQGIAKALWAFAKNELGDHTYSVRSSIFAIPVYQSFGFIKTSPPSSKEGVCFQPMTLAGDKSSC